MPIFASIGMQEANGRGGAAADDELAAMRGSVMRAAAMLGSPSSASATRSFSCVERGPYPNSRSTYSAKPPKPRCTCAAVRNAASKQRPSSTSAAARCRASRDSASCACTHSLGSPSTSIAPELVPTMFHHYHADFTPPQRRAARLSRHTSEAHSAGPANVRVRARWTAWRRELVAFARMEAWSSGMPSTKIVRRGAFFDRWRSRPSPAAGASAESPGARPRRRCSRMLGGSHFSFIVSRATRP